MNALQINDKKSNSIVLNLESLSKQYQNKLIEYQQAVGNYINYLKQEEEPVMSAIRGAAYWGTTSISQNNSATLQECQALCSNTPGCTGATFNLTTYENPKCWLRGGEGNISSGLDNDYAIVSKKKQLIQIIQSINEELTNINKQIQQKTKLEQPLYNSTSKDRNLSNVSLINQFNQLTQEREKINKVINNYQTLEEDQQTGNIKINQNYYSFILLTALVIIILFLLYKFVLHSSKENTPSLIQSGGKLGINAYYIIFGIILTIILVIVKFMVNGINSKENI